MRRFKATGYALLLTAGLAGAQAPAELVRNGEFSEGRDGRAPGWSGPDGITAFWEKDGGNPGGCLRFDTSVLQRDKQAHQADPQGLPKRSEGGQYQTVGAHEGVWAFSLPIPVTPDDRYFIVTADVKGPARSTALFYPQVLIRGYQKYHQARQGEHASFFQVPHPGGPAYSEQFGKEHRPARPGDYLMVYRHSLVCRLEKAGTWGHYELGVKLPTIAKYRPDVLLLKPYAMWPLGNYRFDNISLRRVSKADYDAVRRKGHSARGFMPGDQGPSQPEDER
jgi:hypothetical protein